jgi:LCP family protein required for cell wall assembly
MTNKKTTHPVQKKRKRNISARFLWLISLFAGIAFFITFLLTPVFPLKWSLIVFGVLLVIFGLTLLLNIKTSPKNVVTKTVNIILTIVLFIATIMVPYEVDKVSGLFNQMTGGTEVINVYRMSDDYAKRNNFKNVYSYDNDNGKANDLASLKDAQFITSMVTDNENTAYALTEMNKSFGENAKTSEHTSYLDACASLYSHDGDFLIMPVSYEGMVEGSAAYADFKTDTVVAYSFTRTIAKTSTVKGDTTLTTKPFTIFFGGNDETGALNTAKGRTDVCMIVTVNPNTHQVSIVNLPRDSYVPNPAYGTGDSSYDKLTHLGLSGIDNTLKGLSSYLDESINNYVFLNFDTFWDIMVVLDGVDIDNPYTFDALDGEHFEAGPMHLTAESGLMYVREREGLPDGDFGRNEHQQIVMTAIIDKITSADGILKFNSILDSIKGDFLTNISSDAIYGLVNKQLNENMSWNIVKYHVIGETGMEQCASAPGEYLSVVYPYPNQVEYVKDIINQVDDGQIMTQEDLPEGKYNTTSTTKSN